VAYLLVEDVIARAVVTPNEIRVRSFVRDGGRTPHGLVIGATCKFIDAPFNVFDKFEEDGELVARCAPLYPVMTAQISLGKEAEF
jgi:hypothetical protein